MFTEAELASFGISNALLVAVTGVIIVLLELALIACFIVIISKLINKFLNKEKTAEPVTPVTTDDNAVKTVGNRSVKLIDVDEKTAAMIMALVSHQSDIPLDRLDFKSIKKVD